MSLAVILDHAVAGAKTDGFRYFLIPYSQPQAIDQLDRFVVTGVRRQKDGWDVGVVSHVFEHIAAGSEKGKKILSVFSEIPYSSAEEMHWKAF